MYAWLRPNGGPIYSKAIRPQIIGLVVTDQV